MREHAGSLLRVNGACACSIFLHAILPVHRQPSPLFATPYLLMLGERLSQNIYESGRIQHPHIPPTDMAQPVVHSRRSPFYPKALFSRLPTYLRRLSHPDTSLEGVGSPLPTTDVPDQFGSSPPGIDPGALCEHIVDLVHHLQSLLPSDCKWLEEGAIEVVGERPVDAGGFADVWVGMMENRKVAIKSYRCYSSSDYLPTYVVSGTCHVACIPLTQNLSVEILQRDIGV